jgi:hypothetical protein
MTDVDNVFLLPGAQSRVKLGLACGDNVEASRFSKLAYRDSHLREKVQWKKWCKSLAETVFQEKKRSRSLH